jgi:DNA-binding MarR family transcriptional regulator
MGLTMPQADTRQSPARAPWADAWSGQESSYRLLRSVHILSVLVSEILESKFLRRISPLPLNLSQLHLLKLMSFDGLRQVGDVAGSLGVSAPAATKNIDKLERLGLVIRTRSTGDRRTTLVSLSPEGRQLVREYERTKAFHLSSILGSFRPEELREFAALVERFCASLLGAEPPAAGPCMRCAAYLQEGCLVSEVSGGCPYRGVYSGHGTERAAGPPACSGDGVLWSE